VDATGVEEVRRGGDDLEGLLELDDAILRGGATPLGAGIHEGVAADDGAGGEDRVAADLRAVADDGAKFAEAGGDHAAVVGDGDLRVIEADIGEDDAGGEMALEADDGIADVVEVGDFGFIEDDGVLELAGVGP